MGVQFRHATPGREFRPTDKGIKDYFMDSRFSQKPSYKLKVPKHWIDKGWVREVRVGWIK